MQTNSKGSDVSNMQKALIDYNWWDRADEQYFNETGTHLSRPGQDGVDFGTFGNATKYVVNYYKNSNGLWNEGNLNGVVGATTWQHMGFSLSNSSKFSYTDNGWRVTQPFGDFYKAMGGCHLGVDLVNNSDPSIKSMYSGTVTRAGWINGYGNAVIIQSDVDGQSYNFIYAHMRNNSISVSAGDSVNSGQTIGVMGNTGIGTGPHLHIAMFQSNSANITRGYSGASFSGSSYFDPRTRVTSFNPLN